MVNPNDWREDRSVLRYLDIQGVVVYAYEAETILFCGFCFSPAKATNILMSRSKTEIKNSIAVYSTMSASAAKHHLIVRITRCENKKHLLLGYPVQVPVASFHVTTPVYTFDGSIWSIWIHCEVSSGSALPNTPTDLHLYEIKTE